MLKQRLIALKLAAILMLAGGGLVATTPFEPAQAASASKINSRVQETLSDFRREVPGANQVLSRAQGVLVFPRVYQAGFVLGGEYGQGALLVNGKTVDYYSITSGSVGWQLGGQRKGIIIVFMTPESLKDFRKGSGWDIGADASAAILVTGAEGSIDVSTLNRPVLAFVVGQKGLMAGLTLEGSKISRIAK